jgi:signal transduction histidine kinase/CheY-like chemotaxis protein
MKALDSAGPPGDKPPHSALCTLYEGLPFAVFAIDPDWVVLALNPAGARLLGTDAETVRGRKLTDFGWRIQQPFEELRASATELSSLAGVELTGKDGARPLRVWARPAGWEENPSALYLIAQDADDGRAAGATPQAGEEADSARLAAFPRFNPYAVLEFSQRGEVTYCNEAAFELAKSFGKAHPREILPSNATAIVQNCLAANQSRVRLEQTIADRVVSWSFFPVRPNQVVHCYASEITERQNLERQLLQSQKMDCVGQLAGGIAHDFNNILTIIGGHVGLLQQEAASNTAMEASLGEIVLATERAANLTQQLLAFGRRQVIQPRLVNVSGLLRGVARVLPALLPDSIKLVIDCADDVPPIQADHALIEQALLNLAMNARDAMPEGGTLTIGASSLHLTEAEASRSPEARPGPCVRVFVSDTGVGISPENFSRLFEPFFTTKEVGTASGLGLATVYGIVKQHHGWTRVSTRLGNGSTFSLFLPVLAPGEIAPSPTPPPLVVSAPKRVDGAILVAEDEAPLRELIRLFLNKRGYRAFEASNGDEALDLWRARRSEIVLVLSDVVMPGGMSGVELARRLQEEAPGLPVILSSGYSPEFAGRDLSQLENIGYLQKPYSPQALLEMINQRLST